jgi:methionyl-tRNA formyltransferase
MRIAFMGSPDFAVVVLDALLGAADVDVVAVYTQPPRVAGRGQSERPTPVARRAIAAGLETRWPASLKGEAEQAAFAALDIDVAVVAAYGLILPKAVLAAPRHGCLNLHASLLPRWRGAAPIQRAIEAGDPVTGVDVMIMEAGLDTGPRIARATTRIDAADDAGSLHDRLADLAAALIVPAMEAHVAGAATPISQPEDGICYAHKIDKAELAINWSDPAAVVARRIRAFAPVPGAWFTLNERGTSVRVKALGAFAEMEAAVAAPGMVLDDALLVACGEGAVRLTRLQREGKGPMSAGDFLRGTPVAAGAVLGGAG